MNTNSKRLGIYLAVMLLATAVATTLRTIACVMHLDYASGFFTEGSLISTANTITALTLFGMLSYLFTASRISLRASFSTGATYVPTGILGVASAFLGVKVFSYVLAINNYRLFNFRVSSVAELIGEIMTPLGISTLIGLLTAVLAFVSIAHHFFNAFVTESKDVTRAYFALASICFLAFYAILIYLDGSIALNEASKTLRQITFLIAATFLLYEARISLGREMWRIYTTFGLIAATLTAYTSIPAIITYYAKGAVVSSASYKSLASLEEYLLLLALFIFIVSRLALTAMLTEEKKSELVEALVSAAKEREAEVADATERYNEVFASKQLSIFDLYGDEEAPEPETVVEAPMQEEEPQEEEKEPTISDDAIYEAIFGKMPERHKETEAAVVEDEPQDDRDPETIAEELLSAIDEVMNEDA